MKRKLNKTQIEMISGGSSYCIFPDGKVLVCFAGETDNWVLYDSWYKAVTEVNRSHFLGIGSFAPKNASDNTFVKMRKTLEKQN